MPVTTRIPTRAEVAAMSPREHKALENQLRRQAKRKGRLLRRAAEWRDHGLRYAVMADASVIQPSLRRGLAASVPFARILRGLRKL